MVIQQITCVMYLKKGIIVLLVLLSTAASHAQVCINEFLASNAATITDPDFDSYADWIELYNSGETAINLKGYSLTDNLGDAQKWTFTTDLVLPAGGYLVLWCDDKATGLHAPFKLSASGEAIGLYDATLRLIDSIRYEPQYTDISMGRSPNGGNTWVYYTKVTPGTSNDTTGYAGQVQSMPEFTLQGGAYTSPVDVSLFTDMGGTIRYTLNGDEPSEESPVLTNPLRLEKTTIVRARVFKTGYIAGPVQTHTYFVGNLFPEKNLPVVSIATDSVNFWGASRGIYVQTFKPEWEVPVNIELFENNGSDRAAFNERAGIKINGLYSWQLPQKMLGVYFRKQYGSSKLESPLFFDRARSTFDNFALRASGSDWSYTMFRDGLVQQACHNYNMSLDNMAFRPSVVYVNGKYMGIHNIREKVDEDFVASNHGLKVGEFDLIENGDYVESGSIDAWNTYWTLVNQDLSIQSNYDTVARYMDIENFADLIITEAYSGNSSIDHNTMAWKPKNGGKWRWILMDLDRGFFEYDKYPLSFYSNQTVWPLAKLLKNPGFKRYLGTRMADHLFTTFNPIRMVSRIRDHATAIENEMPKHIQQWLGTTSSYGDAIPSMSYWRNEVANLETYAEARPIVLLQDLKNYGFDTPATFSLSVFPADAGNWSFNGMRVDSGTWSGPYPKNLPFTLEAKPKPGYNLKGWATVTRTELIAKNASWKYLDNGTDQGTDWRGLSFDDSGWKAGTAPLGYGQTGMATTIGYGTSSTNKYITSYFRKSFSVDANTLANGQFTLYLMRDDGAVVYLNGKPIIRTNMPTGTINYKTYASTAISNAAETTYVPYTIDKADLQAGTNTLAVEVHQVTASSSDVTFGIQLLAQVVNPASLSPATPAKTISLTGDTLIMAVYQLTTSSILKDTIPAGTVLHKSASPYLAQGTLVVPEHTTLVIEPGVEILMPADANLMVHGAIEALGTETDSITFRLNPAKAGDGYWGAICFIHATDTTRMRYVSVRNASQGPALYRCVAALSAFDADLVLDHMNLTDNTANPVALRYSSLHITNSDLHSKVLGDLINVKYGKGYIENCRFTGNDYPDTDGIDYDDVQNGVIRNVIIHDFKGSNSDAIDIGEEAINIRIDSILIYNVTDKGISVGQRSRVFIKDATIINTNLGVGVKDSSYLEVDQSTFFGVATPIATYEKIAGRAGGNVVVRNSILSNSYDQTTLCDDKSTLQVYNSHSDNDPLQTGNDNYFGPVGFPAPGLYDLGQGTTMVEGRGSSFFPEKPKPSPTITAIFFNGNKATDRSEFIRLTNPGSETLDLSDYSLANAVQYSFPKNCLLEPGKSLLVVKDKFMHTKWMADPAVHMWSDGSLANEGEAIRLCDDNGTVVDQTVYSITSPWPSVAGSDEQALVFNALNKDNHLGENWTTGSYTTLINGLTAIRVNPALLYPNPTKGPVTVHLPASSSERLNIYDLTGHSILTATVVDGQQLDLTHLPNGLYLVKVGNRTEKLRKY